MIKIQFVHAIVANMGTFNKQEKYVDLKYIDQEGGLFHSYEFDCYNKSAVNTLKKFNIGDKVYAQIEYKYEEYTDNLISAKILKMKKEK